MSGDAMDAGVIENPIQQTAKLPIVTPGRSSPLGATIVDGGVNFSVFSRNATGIDLLLFDREDDSRPSRVIPLDPGISRSYHYWHAFVAEL